MKRGIALYREEIKREPLNGEHYLGLGSIYKGIGREEKAKELLRQAVDLDPSLIEGYYSLALLLYQDKQSLEAFSLLQQGVERLPNVRFRESVMPHQRQFAQNYAEAYNGLKDILELSGPYLHPGIFGARKVGRNDPCPCGSGKKFKKCCME